MSEAGRQSQFESRLGAPCVLLAARTSDWQVSEASAFHSAVADHTRR